MATVTMSEITDPFCTWCWGAEPMLRRVEETYREQVEFDFVMGGLVDDFETFSDAANGISEPRDAAPHWEAASEQHGMPVDADIWRENPPQSSFPANVAYEAAEFQGRTLAHRYLRRLREAVATERKDISRTSVLVELADEVGLDTDVFVDDLQGNEAELAFRSDHQFVRQEEAVAFPSFRVAADGEETWIRGFQSFVALRDAIEHVAPDLTEYDPRPIPEFVSQRGRVTTQEVAEVYEMSPGRTIQALRSLEVEGTLSSKSAGNGFYWRTADGESHPQFGPTSPLQDTKPGSHVVSMTTAQRTSPDPVWAPTLQGSREELPNTAMSSNVIACLSPEHDLDNGSEQVTLVAL